MHSTCSNISFQLTPPHTHASRCCIHTIYVSTMVEETAKAATVHGHHGYGQGVGVVGARFTGSLSPATETHDLRATFGCCCVSDQRHPAKQRSPFLDILCEWGLGIVRQTVVFDEVREIFPTSPTHLRIPKCRLLQSINIHGGCAANISAEIHRWAPHGQNNVGGGAAMPASHQRAQPCLRGVSRGGFISEALKTSRDDTLVSATCKQPFLRLPRRRWEAPLSA